MRGSWTTATAMALVLAIGLAACGSSSKDSGGGDNGDLSGSIQVSFGSSLTKAFTEFAKEFEDKPAMKGGMLQGKAIDNAQMKRMASLPSREQMLADLAAGMQSPMAAFAGALSGLFYMFAGALDALKSQREGA